VKLGLSQCRKNRLRVFKNRVLRIIFRPTRKEVTEGRRKLHNKELHNLYFSPYIYRITMSRRMKCTGQGRWQVA
jgi:hypothetical protein